MVDEDLEEVDLGQIAGAIRQGHEDLAPLPLPLRDRGLDRGDPLGVALGEEHPVQPRGRQPLLPTGPLGRLREQRLARPATFAQTGRGRGSVSAFRTVR